MLSGRSSWPMTTVSCCAASASRIPLSRQAQRAYGLPPAAASSPVSSRWRHADIAEHGGTALFSPRDIATPLAALIADDIPGTPVLLGL